MVDFCNPSVLGTPGEFRRYFANAILAGREPGAADADVALGEERSGELSSLVNQFILRRTNKVLSDHLPPKVTGARCTTYWSYSRRATNYAHLPLLVAYVCVLVWLHALVCGFINRTQYTKSLAMWQACMLHHTSVFIAFEYNSRPCHSSIAAHGLPLTLCHQILLSYCHQWLKSTYKCAV